MTRRFAVLVCAAVLAGSAPRPVAAAPPQATLDQAQLENQDRADAKKGKGAPWDVEKEIVASFLRLPAAAALGAALALRPRRRGTPPRQPAVVQTQIILSIVGAVVMMIVGSDLARAFGIVGAAGLVRYRARIEDPKDAGVMLTTLAVGLAIGVGLYAMAAASTVFILLTLWLIESFEPNTRRLYDLKIRMGDDTDERRGRFEVVLRRYHVDFELRAAAGDEVTYEVRAPFELSRDRVTNALLELDPKGHGAVDWTEKKPKAK